MESLSRPTRVLVGVLIAVLMALAFGLASPALGQGKSGGKPHAPPGQAKKKVTTVEAVVVTRDVLVAHGYEVVRVEKVGLTQIIYYRRGNNGRGRGLGPLERMVVKPSGERVVFELAPPKVLVAINVKLGL